MSKANKKVIVIATRADSNRLPGKIFLDYKGHPVLGYMINVCKDSGIPTILATTTRECDDPIELLAKQYDVSCYRWDGHWNDVLGRVTWAVGQYGLKHFRDIIVRVTHDCLGLTPDTIKDTVSHLHEEYVYASPEVGFPKGTGCEAFSYRALKTANLKATKAYDREHVTPYIQENFSWSHWDPRFRGLINMELNTEEDYLRIKKYEEMF